MFLYPTTGKYKSTNVRVFLCIFSVEAGRQHQRQRGVITPFLILKPVGQDFFLVSVQANLPRQGCHLRTRDSEGAPRDQ